MLQEICEHIHNYFIKTSYESRYEIADNMVSLPLLDGQRFLIIGSMLNDGMYTYHDTGIKNDDDDADWVGLKDETFAGTICALAVPPAVIALSKEVKAWVAKYGEVINSPYTSEDVIGVYSYTKGSRNGSSEAVPTSWQQAFGNELNRWRKVAF